MRSNGASKKQQPASTLQPISEKPLSAAKETSPSPTMLQQSAATGPPLEVGTKVCILTTDNVLQRAPHLIGSVGIIKEVPVHPATWFKVQFDNNKIMTFRPSALEAVFSDDEEEKKGKSMRAQVPRRNSEATDGENGADDSNSSPDKRSAVRRRPSLDLAASAVMKSAASLSEDKWVGKLVRILVGRGENLTGKVLRTGNGWVQLMTKTGELAKRAYELEICEEKPGGGRGNGESSRRSSGVRDAVDSSEEAQLEAQEATTETVSISSEGAILQPAPSRRRGWKPSTDSDDGSKQAKRLTAGSGTEEEPEETLGRRKRTVAHALTNPDFVDFEPVGKSRRTVLSASTTIASGSRRTTQAKQSANRRSSGQRENPSLQPSPTTLGGPRGAQHTSPMTTNSLSPVNGNVVEEVPRFGMRSRARGLSDVGTDDSTQLTVNRAVTRPRTNATRSQSALAVQISNSQALRSGSNNADVATKKNPKISSTMRESKRMMVQRYVDRHVEKIKDRPDLGYWLRQLNGSCIDVAYEYSQARPAFENYCTVCYKEKWLGAQFCWNELCPSSTIYWKLPGARGHCPGQGPAPRATGNHQQAKNHEHTEVDQPDGSPTGSENQGCELTGIGRLRVDCKPDTSMIAEYLWAAPMQLASSLAPSN